ncbi:MAG: PorP/SprF family type IX secretion system membrane protein [Pontibacter sp.]|nr:PorP/SprF family type IX secretion system membrane protein [Pontibacter sp.]
MKRYILLAFLLGVVWPVQAQNRKQLASFPQFRHTYNPSLTGAEGTVFRSVYRNQWTGFEDAPKTIIASAELDLKRSGNTYFKGQSNREESGAAGAKHALGVNVYHDQFGPARETQAGLSYSAAVRLSEAVSLRWGATLTYTLNNLDGNSLTVDQENDPQYTRLLGQENRSGRADINLGLSLVAANYYFGYAIQDVTEGRVLSTGSDYLNDYFTRRHVLLGGYRVGITDMVGLSLNGIYQYDEKLKSTLEGQAKVIYNNMLWLGGGYRKELAYTLGAGVQLGQLTIGYTYESPTQNARAIDKATNEIMLSYRLHPFQSDRRNKRQLTIW